MAERLLAADGRFAIRYDWPAPTAVFTRARELSGITASLDPVLPIEAESRFDADVKPAFNKPAHLTEGGPSAQISIAMMAGATDIDVTVCS